MFASCGVVRRGLCTVVLFSLLAWGSTSEAKRRGRDARLFFEPVEVPLVNVEIYAFDSNGKPVPGLTVDDFEIYDTGEPVEITHFYAAPAVAEEEPQAEAEEEQPPAEQVASQKLSLVVVVDSTNISNTTRRLAIDNLRGFLEQDLPGGLEVMLVTYDGVMRVRQSLGDDREGLLTALSEMETEASLPMDAQKTSLIRDMQRNATVTGGSPGGGLGGMSSEAEVADEYAKGLLHDIEGYAQQHRQLERRTINALGRFVRSLAGWPGRKALFFVSDGLEMRPGEDLFTVWESSYPDIAHQLNRTAAMESRRFSVHDPMRRLVELANAYRVSFYVLDGTSKGVMSTVSAENFGLSQSSGIEAMPFLSKDEAATEMTAGTGGRHLVNNPKLSEQLEEVAEELGAYYSLAFRPAHGADGEYHPIKVKVKRDGVKLRYREGYRSTSPEDAMADRTLSAAIHGVTDNPMGISVNSRTQQDRGDGTFLVPILIQVPIGQLVLLPQQATHDGRISIFVVVRDSNGGVSDVVRREYPVEIPNESLLTAISQNAGFTMGLAMRPGKQLVAVGVRDDLAGVESTVTIELEVGAAADDGSDASSH